MAKKDSGNDKVAKALLAGETDRKKIMREVGVSVSTVYNGTSDLANLGYTLPIHVKKRVPPPSLPTYLSTYLPTSLPTYLTLCLATWFSENGCSTYLSRSYSEQSGAIMVSMSARNEEKKSEKSGQKSTQAAPTEGQDLVQTI